MTAQAVTWIMLYPWDALSAAMCTAGVIVAGLALAHRGGAQRQ